MNSNNLPGFFSKELTCLPSLFDKYVGKYYNNAMGNAISWGFCLWFLIHFLFDRCTNAILKQMKYPEYVRNRIKSTLWNFGLAAASFLYCYATLSRNNIEILNFRYKFMLKNTEYVPGHYIFGFMILSTYYAQGFFWESTQNNSMIGAFENLTLLAIASLCYINRCIELFFMIIYVNNLLQCILELSRTFSFQMYNKSFMNIISLIYFILHVSSSILFFIAIIPLYIFIPVNKHLINNLSVGFVLLNVLIWIWLISSIYNSAVMRLVKHYIWHDGSSKDSYCGKKYFECGLFLPRKDTAFNVFQVRREIEERHDLLNLKRKNPKYAFYQTLKCMVTVRRKIKNKRMQGQTNLLSGNEENFDVKNMVQKMLDEIIDNVGHSEDGNLSENK